MSLKGDRKPLASREWLSILLSRILSHQSVNLVMGRFLQLYYSVENTRGARGNAGIMSAQYASWVFGMICEANVPSCGQERSKLGRHIGEQHCRII